MFIELAYAQDATPKGPTLFDSLVPFIFLFVIIYFFIIRPQSKRTKDHQKFLESLKKGDQILTASGILGTVEGLTEKFVTVEISEGVKVKMLKAQISQSFKELKP